MRLVNVELKRFWSRQLVWYAASALIAIVVLTVVGSYFSSKPMSEADLAQQEQWFQESVKDWEEYGEQQVAECYEYQEADRLEQGDDSIDHGCEYMTAPTRGDYFSWQPGFASDAQDTVQGLALAFLGIGLLIGASLIAAEIHTGALGNWLTFEPRRTRVFFSKIGSAALGIVPIAVVALVVLIGGMWGAYALNDALGTGSGWVEPLVWSTLRVIGLTVIGVILGLALGTVLRHTAAAFGAVIAYSIIVEAILSNFIPTWQPWLVGTNLQGWIAKGTTYYLEICTPVAEGGTQCEYLDKDLSFTHASIYLTVVTLVCVLVAWLVFRRRDVN